MIRTFYGALLGAIVGSLPGLICVALAPARFWTLKLLFVMFAGTAAIIGAIAGSTSAVLATFRKHRRAGSSSASLSEDATSKRS